MPQQPEPKMKFASIPQAPGQNPQPRTVTEHPEDIVIVRNIDVDCDEVAYDTVDQTISEPTINPTTQQPDGYNHIHNETGEIEYDHSKGFTVRWGGAPFTIAPGDTRMMPRYVAKHYAKHLADHVLQKREEREKRRGLVQSRIERPKVLSQIIVGVQSSFGGTLEVPEGIAALNQVEQLNTERAADTMSVGTVNDPMIGELRDEPTKVEDILEQIENEPELSEGTRDDKGRVVKTKKELVAEAAELGLEVTGKETKEQLRSMMENF